MLNDIYSQSLIFLSFLIFILIIIYASLALRFKNKTAFEIFNLFIFFISIYGILYLTILEREIDNYIIEFTPFYTFVMAQDQPEYYRSFFMNVLLFVPLGLSMPYLLSKKPHKRNVFITIGFGAVLSAAIEFLQYYYHLGRCETDDVIANTLGAAVGTLSYLLYIRILKNREESLMNSKINDNQNLLLNLCAKSLFNIEYNLPSEFDAQELIYEAKRQTVLLQVFSFVKDKCANDADKLFSQIIAKNIRVEFGHNEVHEALSKNGIPYVVIKGVASASYYNKPTLRMMGDIDILVSPENILKADAALKAIGFNTKDSFNGNQKHIAYKRRDGLVCELHRSINGIPKNAVGKQIERYFNDIFDKSVEYKTSNGVCIVPSDFHHGLVLLLHTATHLTNEGVGLRHLCDWAVFVNSFSNDEFISLFEKPLKDVGLWRFAQLLTLCGVKHLGCETKAWAGQSDDILLDDIITDILNGGNFGFKDTTRYSHIKYIGDRNNKTVSRKNPIFQLFDSLNAKTKSECNFVEKHKILLPIGWVATLCKYIGLVISGKRKYDNFVTINNAVKRKNIYREFNLFEKD